MLSFKWLSVWLSNLNVLALGGRLVSYQICLKILNRIRLRCLMIDRIIWKMPILRQDILDLIWRIMVNIPRNICCPRILLNWGHMWLTNRAIRIDNVWLNENTLISKMLLSQSILKLCLLVHYLRLIFKFTNIQILFRWLASIHNNLWYFFDLGCQVILLLKL